ncbi:MAG: SIMPL domain-containing protein [Erysipelothrix sp.]|nr:SIMPL domain-containing protein [Erysipelothrix sp.]
MEKKKDTLKISVDVNQKFTPDLIVLSIHDTQLARDTKQALELSNTLFSKLQSSLQHLGFDESALKTRSYNTFEKREYVDQREKVLGIQYTHELELSFLRESNQLDAVLSLFLKDFKTTTFTINYQLSKMDELKDQLLTKAIQQAIHKAKIIADAATMKLGTIVSVTNQQIVDDIPLYARPERNMAMKAMDSGLEFNQMTPVEQELSESITVEFEIL